MRAVVILVVGVVLGVGCGGTSTGGRQTDGAAGSTLASGGTSSSGVGGGVGGDATPASGGSGSPSSGGSTADGGTGTGGAGTAATVADLCPELVAAGCAALAAYLPDEASCVAVLPMLSSLCQPAADDLLDCTGPDPDITCDAAGAPTSAGCGSEWSAVMACVAQLMAGAAGG